MQHNQINQYPRKSLISFLASKKCYRCGQHLATHAQSRALPLHTRTQGTLRRPPRTRTTQEMTTCTAPRGRSHSSSDGISSSSSCSLLALRNSNFKKNKKKNVEKKRWYGDGCYGLGFDPPIPSVTMTDGGFGSPIPSATDDGWGVSLNRSVSFIRRRIGLL
jgi:hypothetical protein